MGICRKSCANPGISSEGSRSVGQRKTLMFLLCVFFVFFSPQLILQKSNGQFQRNLSFFKVPEGVQHFPGGSNFFQGVGVQLLIPYRNPYNLSFSRGGSGPPVPPLDPHLESDIFCVFFLVDEGNEDPNTTKSRPPLADAMVFGWWVDDGP